MSKPIPIDSTLAQLADLAGLPEHQTNQSPPPGGKAWYSLRPILLPPSVIPGKSDATVPNDPSPSPCPRNCHATPATVTPSGDIYISAGQTGLSLDDIYVYSTRENTASLIQCFGDIPSPRTCHSCALIGNVLILYGDHWVGDDNALYMLNLRTYLP
jgi:hypothetical protein